MNDSNNEKQQIWMLSILVCLIIPLGKLKVKKEGKEEVIKFRWWCFMVPHEIRSHG